MGKEIGEAVGRCHQHITLGVLESNKMCSLWWALVRTACSVLSDNWNPLTPLAFD